MKVAVDIGGTYIRYTINGKTENIKTSSVSLEGFFETLIKNGAEKIAVSFAGQVYKNRILSSPNINIKGLDIEKLQQKAQILIENDLNCAAIAQSEYFKAENIAALYSGTGLGSGIVESGRVVRGCKNLAGEIGHVSFEKSPFVCGCGKNDCTELFASGRGLWLWSGYYGCENEYSKTCEIVKNRYLEALSFAASTLITLFNPSLLVLGGGVIENNPEIADAVKKRIKLPNFTNCDIVLTKIKNASLKGAEIILEKDYYVN